MKLPDKEPNYISNSGMKVWFDEMLCYTVVYRGGNFYLCNIILTLQKELAIVIPDGFNERSGSIFSSVEPGELMLFKDHINDLYWKWVAENILLDDYGTHKP